MFDLVVYLRVDGVVGTVVDSYAQRSYATPTIARGLAARLSLRPLHVDGSPFALSELDYAAWDFVVAHDWITTTPPQIRIQTDIEVVEVEEGEVTYAEIQIPLTNTNTEELIAVLGSTEGSTLGAELAGIPEGDSIPGILIQFDLGVRNRRGTAATGTPTPVGDGTYSSSQVDALLVVKAGHSITAPAAEIIHGHRAAWITADGVYHASSDIPASAPGTLGITANAAEIAADVQVRVLGSMTEPTWAWTPGQPIYVGVGGALTQTPPAAGYIREIALAVTATTVLIRPMMPITLAA